MKIFIEQTIWFNTKYNQKQYITRTSDGSFVRISTSRKDAQRDKNELEKLCA